MKRCQDRDYLDRIAKALALFQRVLLVQERILGPDDPGVSASRSNTASWTGTCRHPAEALRLFKKLLPDEERVLGPDHPPTLAAQRAIQRMSAPDEPPDG